MTALNFKTIVIGLTSLLVVSVAHGKCYPGLDCPEDLPNANNAPSQPVPAPSTSQQEPEPAAAPPESTADEPQPVGRIVGWKVPKESNDASEESPALTKYGNYGKQSKYSK
ncbi:MAG: hypothetical protein LUQ18_06965 [Methylococcaceae bacterium]|nr:hypothetical protein [Methylococcaceae bacterium]